MLSPDDLLEFAKVRNMPIERRRGVVREYLQTLVLFYIQRSRFADKMVFIGGTALRFFYDLKRFSEDLDFNYLGKLEKNDLEELLKEIKTGLQGENIKIDFSIHKSNETYFHWKVYLQFHDVLQAYGCASKSGSKLHKQEKLSVQLDFQNLGTRDYPVNAVVIPAFGKRFLFNTTNLQMFLAEKSNAMLYRKEPRGRDFFDFMSLISYGAKIDINYLKKRDVNVSSADEYKKILIERVANLNFEDLTSQLAPFLFEEEDVKIMKNLSKYFEGLLKKL